MFNCALSFSETFHENYCLFTSYMNYNLHIINVRIFTSKSGRRWSISGNVTSLFPFRINFFNFPHLIKKRKTCSYIQAKIISSRFSLQMCILWKVNQTGHPFYYLHSPSGISSRLLYAALNISKLWSFPMFAGIPSKSSLLELRYNFFKEDSLCREP